MTEAMTTATMTTRSPLPPFTRESAIQKVRLAEDSWNSRDPGKYSLDHVLGLHTAIPRFANGIVVACGVFGAFGNLALRHTPELAPKSS